MSFTEDELQAFNTILEQRLSAQRQEMERYLNAFWRDIEQRFVTAQQEIVRNLTLKLTELQNGLDAILSQKLNAQQIRIAQTISNTFEERQQQSEGSMDRMLAAQLLGIEQLLSQQLSLHIPNSEALQADGTLPQLDAIEVQTELPWEDLMNVIGKALDERLTALHQSMQIAMNDVKQDLIRHLRKERNEFIPEQVQFPDREGLSTQEVLQEMEHLGRIVESMQVAMSSNQALLSNRLYHHQQLPLERAHPASQAPATASNSMPDSSLIVKEHSVERQEGAEEFQEQ
jgi:hypothetical protein